jgi:hypothetical protein
MSDKPAKNSSSERAWLILRLIQETGVTEDEASKLIALVGENWSSLVREARLLKKL